MAPKMNLANGELSAYALACGHCQDWTADGVNRFHDTTADGVRLRADGNAWHVHVRDGERTHATNGSALWVEAANGGQVRADWHTFDSLGEARRFWRSVRALLRAGRPVPYPREVEA
ncbi:hypothetical protein SEA_MACGULLY_97 [Rhodococcus phage MacGully]|nr:hypothetical protein SEA_MACGULLY_97 [Rhodococcus phage MacGully]